MPSDEVVAIADRLYAGPLGGFTAARDAAAKACSESSDAARVKALRKPSLAAWSVNLLVRHENEQIEQVLTLAESLRAAAESLDGEELRALTRQRRQLTTALSTTAGRLARAHGVRLTAPVLDQVEGVLNAAMIDPVAAEVVRTGMVLTSFTSTGLGDFAAAEVCALPDALGHRAASVPVPGEGPPQLQVVPDDTRRLEEAQERLAAAEVEVAAATEDHQVRAALIARLQARGLQLQGELDELRRRLAGLEEEAETVEDELDEARDAGEDAAAVLEAARRDRDAARSDLERLR